MDYIKLNKLFTEALTSITIKELRKWFGASTEQGYDCEIRCGTQADIEFDKDAIQIYCNVADGWPTSYLDTKIIAKVAIIRMKLN